MKRLNKVNGVSLTLIVILMILLMLIIPISAYSDNPEIDQRIYQILESNESTYVVVELVYERSQHLRFNNKELFHSRREAFYEISASTKAVKNPVIASLSSEDFRFEGALELRPIFYGHITRKGFERLSHNNRVKSIKLPARTKIVLSDSVKSINGLDAQNFFGVNGTGEVVCVVDSGIDYTHAGLGACTRTSDINNGSCGKVIGGINILKSVDINGDGDYNDINQGLNFCGYERIAQ